MPRRRRAQFERYLTHSNPRVRDLARGILTEQQRAAEEWHRVPYEDETLAAEGIESGDDAGVSEDPTTTGDDDRGEESEDDIPF